MVSPKGTINGTSEYDEQRSMERPPAATAVDGKQFQWLKHELELTAAAIYAQRWHVESLDAATTTIPISHDAEQR
jgi:hypothetical protein